MTDTPKPELAVADVGDLTDPEATATAAAELFTALTGKPITPAEMADLLAEESGG